MKTFTGKQVKIHGVWYPMTVKANSLKEANEKIKSNNPKKGRFIMKKEIYTKKGELSAYGLACGYVEKRESEFKDKRLSLFMEHGIFSVVFFGHEYINKSFEDLRSARATFKFLTEKHF